MPALLEEVFGDDLEEDALYRATPMPPEIE